MTATEFGTLASYIRIRGDNGGSMNVVHSYIEFAGITAGRAPSFFGYGGSAAYNGGFGRFAANEGNLIGYTFDAGPVKASVSLEADRRAGIISDNFGNAGDYIFSTSNRITGAQPGANRTVAERAFWSDDQADTNMPTVVGALEFSQGMFSGKLAAAAHELRTDHVGADGSITGSKIGWAVLGGVNVQFAPQTQLRFTGIYADGAINYANVSPLNNRFNVVAADGFINPDNDSLSTSTAWSLSANLQHAWTPTITQNVYGVYGRVTPPGFARLGNDIGDSLGIAPTTVGGLPSRYDVWQLGTNVAWQPVSGLTFGADVNYSRMETQHRTAINAPDGLAAENARFSKHDDRWTATLRVQRTF